ncbi:HD domain-containing phosphohydrolase [uncultured Paraglaciecola sp.]|uniref:HD-GYP domain-containing protein n=1 Tax=uncultured Paraglaciecola sp. TaxID=1765024 RepID=UPI0030DC1BA9
MKSHVFLYQLINSISSILAVNDDYTAHHQNNVAVISRMIAQELGLSAFEVEGIRIAAQIHDIGKSAIPNELLTKSGKLNTEEFALIKTHASRAEEVLVGIDFPWPVLDMVLQHHERMDGSGYPKGLVGEQICLGARILAVADLADSMINPRPYRGALGLQAVLEELNTYSQLYDTEVCNTFRKIVSDGGSRLFAAIEIVS